jgi:hypothetical protein
LDTDEIPNADNERRQTGANYIYGATLFPQQINTAASFDRAHAETMGRVMAKVGPCFVFWGVPCTFSPPS